MTPSVVAAASREDSDEQLVRTAGVGSEDARRGALAELTRRMLASSRRLERLTWVLAGLTVVLVCAIVALLIDH